MRESLEEDGRLREGGGRGGCVLRRRDTDSRREKKNKKIEAKTDTT